MDHTNKVRDNVVTAMIENHIGGIRKNENYKNCQIYVFIEKNYGIEHSYINHCSHHSFWSFSVCATF